VSPSDPGIIRFPCHCGHLFELTRDHAASAIQCPKCGRLNDVPALSDMGNLDDDGTLRLKDDDAPATRRPTNAPQVFTSFRRGHIDRDAGDIDLRPTHEDLANVGADRAPDEIPLLDDDANVAPKKPKYDPVTGELIRPVGLAKTPDMVPAAQIPVARVAVPLTYAAGDLRGVMKLSKVLVELFMPVNFIVTLFIFVFYVFFQILDVVIMVLLAAAGVLPVLAHFPLVFVLMGHYARTLVHNGPDAMDELPRPLGSLNWTDDFWRPFVQMFTSLVVCFIPTIVCLMYVPAKFAAAAILPLGLGLFFFPAVFLTVATSGAAANLRPDRLTAVIRIAGGQYMTAFLIWLAAVPMFVFSIVSVAIIPGDVLAKHPGLYKLNHPLVVYPEILLTILVMHLGAWHLGLIYRRFHHDFPWVLQHHVSSRRLDERQRAAQIRAQRRKPRYVQ
jgi:hypothetical protein